MMDPEAQDGTEIVFYSNLLFTSLPCLYLAVVMTVVARVRGHTTLYTFRLYASFHHNIDGFLSGN